jgi:hypothetical protein
MSMSRRLLGVTMLGGLLAVGLLTSACEPAAQDTTVQFVGQCSRAGTINLSIDGASVGSIGGTSTSSAFPVSPGSHTLSARGGAYTWPGRTVSIPEGQAYQLMLTC